MNFSLSPDDGRAFLLAIGLGAIVGVIFGSWIMSALHKLLMATVRIALLGAVVVIGVLLWNGYQASKPQPPLPTALPYQAEVAGPQAPYSTSHQSTPAPSAGRWWEQ